MLTILSITISTVVVGQTLVIGKVVSGEGNLPLAGAIITVKNSKKSVTSDAKGEFSIQANNGDVLEVRSLGYNTAEQKIIGGSISFTLTALSNELNEVVVTALGIKKEKKKLGYAIQEVKGEDLTVARETNVVNQLSGKVAGVTVIASPSGVGGSSRVTIRGERSLDLNKNQPLFVVDGVPISNSVSGASGRGNLEIDFGNGAGFINPDDIESMSVLKGPAASALYGSRAANGVILIKTKAGKKQKGLGIEFSTNTTFETPLKLPKYQTVYGQGNGNGGPFAFGNGAGGGLTDGTDEGWGPAFNGQSYAQYNSPRTLNGQVIPFLGGDLNAPAGSIITPTLWEAEKDNLKNFLQTGRTITNNVAFVGGNSDGDFRLSYTGINQVGMIPNTDLKRNTFSLSGGYKLSSKLTARAFVSYIVGESDNRPSISYGTESIMYLFNCWLPASVRLRDMKRLWQPGLENVR